MSRRLSRNCPRRATFIFSVSEGLEGDTLSMIAFGCESSAGAEEELGVSSYFLFKDTEFDVFMREWQTYNNLEMEIIPIHVQSVIFDQ
jgi:hypothetical protein